MVPDADGSGLLGVLVCPQAAVVAQASTALRASDRVRTTCQARFNLIPISLRTTPAVLSSGNIGSETGIKSVKWVILSSTRVGASVQILRPAPSFHATA